MIPYKEGFKMPKKQLDFDEILKGRQTENQEVEAAAMNKTEKPKRVTMALSILVSDKEKLQRYAEERGMTSASVIHKFIQTLED